MGPASGHPHNLSQSLDVQDQNLPGRCATRLSRVPTCSQGSMREDDEILVLLEGGGPYQQFVRSLGANTSSKTVNGLLLSLFPR